MNYKHFVGKRISAFEQYDDIGPITGVALLLDDENEIETGDDSGYVLEISCPYGTEAMAANILASLEGKTYRGFRAENAVLSPAAELGDGVTVNGGYFMLAHRTVTFGPGHMSEIAAPGESKLEREYIWISPEKKEFDRKIRANRSYIEKTAASIRLGLTSLEKTVSEQGTSISDIKTELSLVPGKITASVKESKEYTDGKVKTISDKYAELSLTVDGIEGRVEGVEGEFAAFLLDTDGFYVMDASGNRTAIRGSSIDVSTLNVQNINFSGVISFGDLTGTDDLLTNVDTALGYADEALEIAEGVDTDLQSLANGTYYDGTFIDGTRVIAPEIYAGMFYATGEGRNNQAAYYIYDSYNQKTDTLGNKVGFLSYDTSGTGTAEEATKRVMLTTLNGTALKLQSDGNMSLAANRIYMMSDTQFSGIVILESACCGSSLPDESDAINGQLFFLFE